MQNQQNLWIRAICVFAVAYLVLRYRDSFLPARDGHPFKIVDIPGRGKGAIATRDIEQGEMIIKEAPLFLVYAGSFEDPAQHIRDIMSGLDVKSRTTFSALSHPVAPDDPNMPLAIFQTNSIKVGDDAAAIFPLISRFNHGCSKAFNSVHSWRKEGVLVVHALKHIKKGEELLISYINTKKPRDQRRTELYETYGFECSCSVCTLHPSNSKRSDTRLSSMTTIQGKFAAWEDEFDGREAVRLAKRVWALGEKEGYWGGRGKLAEDVVNVAVAHEDEKAARQWAELAEEWYGYELGYDSEEAERMRVLRSNPSRHRAWATKDGLRVGGPDMALL